MPFVVSLFQFGTLCNWLGIATPKQHRKIHTAYNTNWVVQTIHATTPEKKNNSEICNCQISYVGSFMIFMSIKTAPVGSFGFCLGLQTLDLGRLATLAVDWQKHRLLAAGEDTPDPNSADVEHRIWGHFVGSCWIIKASRCAKIWRVSDFHPFPCEIDGRVSSQDSILRLRETFRRGRCIGSLQGSLGSLLSARGPSY